MNESFLEKILGYFLALLGIILSVIFYLRQSRKKKLSYRIENNIIIDKTQIVQNLKVSYKDKFLTSFSNSKILIVNNGDETISESDISINEPIKLSLSIDHEILDYKIFYQNFEGVKIERQKKNELIITFDFLNPKDALILNFLHDGSPVDNITLTGRIKQVNKINKLGHQEQRKNQRMILTLTIPWLILMLILKLTIDTKSIWYQIWFFGLIFLLIGLLLIKSEKTWNRPNYLDKLIERMND